MVTKQSIYYYLALPAQASTERGLPFMAKSNDRRASYWLELQAGAHCDWLDQASATGPSGPVVSGISKYPPTDPPRAWRHRSHNYHVTETVALYLLPIRLKWSTVQPVVPCHGTRDNVTCTADTNYQFGTEGLVLVSYNMKNTLALVALAAGLSQVTATGYGFHNAPSYSCPDNSDNQCTSDMTKGFDWSGLNFGSFTSYNGFTYSGYQCSQKFGKRDVLTGRSFQSKCITGKATTDKDSSPKISCDKSKGVEKSSIREFHVTPEFDCDLEFHYTMPDGSSCKHRSSCKASGTIVQNTQCGGATDVTIVYPQQPDKPKDTCDYGIHSIGFDCEGPKPTTHHTYPVSTPTYPANTPGYPVSTPSSPASSPSSPASTPSSPASTPATTPSFPPTSSVPFTYPSYTVSTPAETPSTPAESTPAESTPAESTPAESTPVETPSTPAQSSTIGSSSTAPVSSPSVTPPGSASVPGSYPVYTPSTTSVPAESTPAESTPAESTPAESTPAESTPAESTPAESTPAESTPAESTPVESTPAVSTPAQSTPVVSIPIGSSSTAAVSTPAETPSYSVTSYITTSTVFSTSVQTITSCGPDVPNCPAGSTAVTTVIIPISTTVCPVTETLSQPAGTPTSTSVEAGSTPATYPASSPVGSTPIGSSATSPASQTSSSPSYPVETLPCPSVVPSCLNTWMFAVGCKDNTDSSCYCPDSAFVNNVFACLYAHGESDEVISEAVSYFQGICAPFVPSNPGIATGAETITTVLTVTPTPAPSASYTTIQVVATTVVPCTDSVGEVIPSSSSTVVISTAMTVPQVIFTTITATGAGAGSSSVAVIPGTYPAFTPTPTSGGVAPPYPTGPAITTFTTSPSAGFPVSTPTTTPAIATGGASRVGAGLGFLGMMAMAVAAL
ncbi:hypothetical protein CHU98_g11109 [Xylaria longipes]|nr:hypothetical protein CHU98_g11109 [Xylaria longipes]